MLAVMPCDMLFVLLTVVIWIPFSIDRMEFYLTWVTCDIACHEWKIMILHVSLGLKLKLYEGDNWISCW